QSVASGLSTVNLLVDVNSRVKHDIAYLVRMEPGVQAPDETLAQRSGSCRDSGWLLVQVLRRLGIAARFASGYLIQLVADVKALDGSSGAERDFTDLHAWAEAYIPGAGWVGLDPTSGLLAGEGHIPLACTASPGSAAPITGLTDIANVRFEFEMSVARVHEDPRVTRPYTEAQWHAIDSLGERIDADLAAGDVRLTQGGEPTFVAIDDVDAPEWNITALSPAKRSIAEALLRRLKARFAPGGLLHVGQGKWYPGEPLPRWALGIYWRADGVPLWRDEALLADPRTPGCATIDTARRFIDALVDALRLPAAHVLVAYSPDPSDARADSAANVAGFVLPLKAVHETEGADTAWETGAWPLPDKRLRVLAGSSPLGLRLPLALLPETLSVRTALAVEVRDGHVCVFVPPVDRVIDYCRLIGANAACADHRRGLSTAARTGRARTARDTGPGCHRSERPSRVVMARARRHDTHALRGGTAIAPRDGKVHAGRTARGHRRRQSHYAWRRDGRRQPVVAPPGSAAKPDRLLAEPSRAVVSLLGHVHRPDQPGAAGRRGARRSSLRARDRVPATRPAATPRPASDDAGSRRSAAAPSADRLDRQHASRRVFDRQATFARHADRPARAPRISRVRDAATSPDGGRADAAAACARRAVLAHAVSRSTGALGHDLARSLAAAAFRGGRSARRDRGSESSRPCARARMVRPIRRIPLSAPGQRDVRRHH